MLTYYYVIILLFLLINVINGQDKVLPLEDYRKYPSAVVYWELKPPVTDERLKDDNILCNEPVTIGTKIVQNCLSVSYPANTATCDVYCGGWQRTSFQCWTDTDYVKKWFPTKLHSECFGESTSHTLSNSGDTNSNGNNEESRTNGRLTTNNRGSCSINAGLTYKFTCDNPITTERNAKVGDTRTCTCLSNCIKFKAICQGISWNYTSNRCNETSQIYDDNNLVVTVASPRYMYACKPDYKLIGDNVATCSNGQLLYRNKPECVLGPITPNNGITDTSDRNERMAVPEKMCTMKGIENFCLEDISDARPGQNQSCTCVNNCRSITLTCGNKGLWKNSYSCNYTSYNVKSMMIDITDYKATFSCADEFNLIGNTEANCVNGRFAPDAPICTKVPNCPKQPKSADGICSNVIKETAGGTETYCSCIQNCRNISMKCNRTGMWNWKKIECDVSDTVVTYSENNLDFVLTAKAYSFSCKKGFKTIGATDATCQNGSLSNDKPYCEQMVDNQTLILIALIVILSSILLIIIIIYLLKQFKIISARKPVPIENGGINNEGIENDLNLHVQDDEQEEEEEEDDEPVYESIDYSQIIAKRESIAGRKSGEINQEDIDIENDLYMATPVTPTVQYE